MHRNRQTMQQSRIRSLPARQRHRLCLPTQRGDDDAAAS
jgi:hypothetical protein